MGNFTIKIVMTCWLVVSFAHLSCQRPAKTSGEMSAKSEQPNILFILLDDVGWNDVSYHGSEIRYVLVKAHSHSAFLLIATSILLIATNGLYRTRWKCSHYTTVTTSPTPM